MPVAVKTFRTLGEAAQALAADRSARFLAGGTLVMRALNEGDVSFSTVLRTVDRTFREIRAAGARIEIGAGATMADVIASRDLAFLAPVARAVGGPAVRTMATVGGNLFAPAPYGDFAAALIALDASVALHTGHAERQMPLEDLLAERGRSPSGLVARVSVARPARPDAFRFLKVSRVRPKGVSVLSIAAHLPVENGRLSQVRVAYNGMGPAPMRARAVERALAGKSLDTSGIAEALRVAAEGTQPQTDALASAWYRREVLPVHLRRLLLGEAR